LIVAPASVIVACSNTWNSPVQVGDHQIARQFLKRGARVAFISTPISPFHLGTRFTDELRTRFRNYRSGGTHECDGKLWDYVPGSLVVPHRYGPLSRMPIQRNWYRAAFPDLVRKLQENGFGEVDLLYFRNPIFGFFNQAIRHRRSVYRMADYDAGFSFYTSSTATLERELAQSVDIVAYTAKSLREYVAGHSPRRMLYLPNGVNYAQFASPVAAPKEYSFIPRPIAVYVGSMESWFDFELVARSARALPHVSFVFIGPDDLAQGKLRKIRNIFLLGRRPHAVLPGYLQHAQLGLIPFNRNANSALVDNINPLKLYEYLAAGLPVVSVKWREIESLNSPAFLADDASGFIELIQRALATPPDPGTLQRAALNEDWGTRVDCLLSALEDVGRMA
jgi:glycosyltransferase involved in cell wall biosynthesis